MSLKVKRYYKLLVALTIVATILVLGFGDHGIVAYTVEDDERLVAQAVRYGQSAAVFFDTVIQSTQLVIAQADSQ